MQAINVLLFMNDRNSIKEIQKKLNDEKGCSFNLKLCEYINISINKIDFSGINILIIDYDLLHKIEKNIFDYFKNSTSNKAKIYIFDRDNQKMELKNIVMPDNYLFKDELKGNLLINLIWQAIKEHFVKTEYFSNC